MSILIKPLITEKATAESEKNNRYCFVVSRNSNKIQIRKAVEDSFGVTVLDVRTMNIDGKARTRYTQTAVVKGRSKGYKKAIIQVAPGQSIDFYENV
jgi:large subunit ribosomal protein L23